MAAKALTASGNVTNTGTATLASGTIPGNTGNVTIQYILTKVSGTVAGTAVAQASLDGTNWYTLLSGQGGASFTNTDVASQTYVWFLKDAKALYYRVLITGSGTMVATPSGLIVEDKA